MSKSLRIMFQWLTCLLAAAVFTSVAAAASATIAGSKHDLTTNTGTGNYTTSSTNEICVFCHTPHGGSTTAPLWNRGAPTGTNFTLYSSATLDSGVATGGSLGGVGANSLACLSCHDGVTALDLLINAPGSGGYAAGGLAGANLTYTWTGGSDTIGAGVTQIGRDISNDHPIGVAYCGGFSNSACRDPDFFTTTLMKNGAAATLASASTTDQFWVDTSGGTSGVREKTDMILYVRAFTTPSGNFPSVECASCHEPHGGESGTPFLRISNTASNLCRACHNK